MKTAEKRHFLRTREVPFVAAGAAYAVAMLVLEAQLELDRHCEAERV